MHIFDIWRQSFALLQLEQLKSLLLISLKSTKRLFIHIFKYFWYGCLGLVAILFIKHCYGSYVLNAFWYNFLVNFSLFVVVVFARSSVKEKTFNIIKKLFFANPLALGSIISMSMFSVYLLPVVLLISFFYFDSCLCFRGFVWSISNALKMIMYNVPLFFLLYLFFVGSAVVCGKSEIGSIVVFLLLPIFVTLLMTFYQKRLYDNFTMYKIT